MCGNSAFCQHPGRANGMLVMLVIAVGAILAGQVLADGYRRFLGSRGFAVAVEASGAAPTTSQATNR